MFSPEAQRALKNYVYRLIDPRSGDTFYVGKGKGNRIFQHVTCDLPFDEATGEEDWQEDRVSTKIQTIRDIRAANLDVIHIIHRNGLTEKEALQLEAALIDVYPGLTNQMRGHDVERGPAHVQQLIDIYSAPVITEGLDEPILMLNITHSITSTNSVYEATRGHWVLAPEKAGRVKYILGLANNICRGVFEASEWQPSSQEEGRYVFVGHEAGGEAQQKYKNKRIPDDWVPARGAANPVRYQNCP